jgi:Flp pilus assembly protein TadG
MGGTSHSKQIDARISLHHPDRILAKSPAAVLRSNQAGQVLAFFALVLPLVLLPVAAYTVDASIVAGREAGLQAATAQAAETAAQQLNIGAIRSTGALTLEATAVSRVAAQTLLEEDQGARVDGYTVAGTEVTLVTSESVTLPFSIFIQTVRLHALATARLVAGYDKVS